MTAISSFPKPTLVYLGKLLIGLGLLAVGAIGFLAVKSQMFLRNAAYVQGEVINLKTNDRGGDYTYQPEVRFQTLDGKSVVFVCRVGADPPPRRVGQKVGVYYEKAHPENARMDYFLDLWRDPLLSALVAAGCLVVGAIMLSIGKGTWKSEE